LLMLLLLVRVAAVGRRDERVVHGSCPAKTALCKVRVLVVVIIVIVIIVIVIVLFFRLFQLDVIVLVEGCVGGISHGLVGAG